MDGGRNIALIVVAGLEITGRCIERVGTQRLLAATVDADAQHVLLVPDLVGEPSADGHIADGGEDRATAGARLLHAHNQIAGFVVVELTDRLG